MTVSDTLNLLMDLIKMVNNPEIKGTAGTFLLILSVVLTLLQISKVRINPWSWVASTIGKDLNKDVLKEVKNLKVEINDIRTDFQKQKEQSDEDKAIDSRRRILRAADEIRKGDPHSDEFFTEALSDVDRYETYCRTHPSFENSKADNSITLIKQTHYTATKENKFV